MQVQAWAAVVTEYRPHVETLVTENDAPSNNLGSAKPQQERLFCARTRLRLDSKKFPHATMRQILPAPGCPVCVAISWMTRVRWCMCSH